MPAFLSHAPSFDPPWAQSSKEALHDFLDAALGLSGRSMEFARRGRPATASVDDDRRSPDDPALSQGDDMLVIRDALLSQLEKDSLRQKIIMTEVEKIERVVALRFDTVNREQAKLVSSSGEEFIPHRIHERSIELESRTPAMEDRFGGRSCWSDGKEGMEHAAYDEQKLQGSNESIQGEKASSSEKWKLIEMTMPVKKPKPPQERNCSICQVETPSHSHLQEHFAGKKHQSNVATFKSETTTTKPSFGANQKTNSQKWSCSTCQVEAPSERHLKEHFTGKKHRANVSTLEYRDDVINRKAQAKIKLSFNKNQKTYCSTCQVETPSERHLQEHFIGKKHRANVSTLESRGNVISQKAETKTKLSFDEDQKLYSAKWSCSTCQVETPSERHLQEHFVGKKHRANVSTLESRGNVISHKAETKTKLSFDENQKTYSAKWSCSTCQVQTPSERHLQEHFAGKKHRLCVSTLKSRDKVVSGKAEITTEPSFGTNQATNSVKWSCKECQVETPSERHLQEHLSGKKHQSYVSNLEVKENKPSSGANHKTSSLKWSCSMCQVKTPSERHLQEHCAGKKHRSNVGMAKNINSHEAKWQKCNEPQHPVMPPPIWSCSICQDNCSCESYLVSHLAMVQATPKESNIIGRNFGLQKANLYSSIVTQVHEPNSSSNRSIHQADYDCILDLDKHVRANKHKLDVQGLYEEAGHEEDILPQIAKNQQRVEHQSLQKAEHAGDLCSAELGGGNTLESVIQRVSTVLSVMSLLYFLVAVVLFSSSL